MASLSENGQSTRLFASGFMVFGSLITIGFKLVFSVESTGSSDAQKPFCKPWFIAYLMHLAMSFILPLDSEIRQCVRTGHHVLPEEAEELREGGLDDSVSTESLCGKAALIAAPAMFGAVGTALMYTGLALIPASVWQLLRGAEVIFAQVLKVTLLKHDSWTHHWVGVLACFFGMILIALATLWGERFQVHAASTSADTDGAVSQAIGIALSLGGLLLNTAQITREEYLIKELGLPPLQIIGFEGIWGSVFLAVLLLAAHLLPGSDDGRLEDGMDTLRMLDSSHALVAVLLVLMPTVFMHQACKIFVIGAFTAVQLTMFGALRTAIVWIFGLTVHGYSPSSRFGEAWTPYSPLQLCGFGSIVLGQLIYAGIARLPTF